MFNHVLNPTMLQTVIPRVLVSIPTATTASTVSDTTHVIEWTPEQASGAPAIAMTVVTGLIDHRSAEPKAMTIDSGLNEMSGT